MSEPTDRNADAPVWAGEEAFQALLTCSRRFDGHEYREQMGFEPFPIIDAMVRGERPVLSLDEKMAIFFFIERAWYFDGGLTSLCEWDVYKSLFFEVCEEEVNPRFQIGAYCQDWEARYRPRLVEVKDLIRAAEALSSASGG